MTMPHDRHRRSSVPPRIHVVDADMPVTFQRARELADVPRFRVHEDISVWRKRPGQSCAGLCTEGFPDLGGDGSLASCLIWIPRLQCFRMSGPVFIAPGKPDRPSTDDVLALAVQNEFIKIIRQIIINQ